MGEVVKLQVRLSDVTETAKRAGRQRLAVWLRNVDAKIEAKQLISFDARTARILTKFPSSTLEGHCWAGQERLSRSLTCSRRTAERSLARLKRNGLLLIKQRGPGRSARYIFCVDGKPVFPGLGHLAALCKRGGTEGSDLSAPAASDPPDLSGQAPTDVSELTPSAPTKMAEDSTKQLKLDSFQTNTSLQRRTAATSAAEERKRATDEDKPSIQVIQNAIVNKLGRGDIAQGWLIFGDLPIPIRAELEARERRGDLTDAAIAELLAELRSKAVAEGT